MKEDNILGIIGGIGISAVAGAVGAVVDIFNAFFGNNRETWRDKVRSEVIQAYSGQGDKMAAVIKVFYQTKTDALCQNLQESINARIADMERQLQDILREKETQEQDAAKKKSYLLSKRDELHRISQELNRLVL